MSEFVPLSELDASMYSLPVPEALDASRIGLNVKRLRGIAALGGFIADETRIMSAAGESSDESVGIGGTSGHAAFGAMSASARKARTADSQLGNGYRLDAMPTRRPSSVTITLNSTAIAEQAQATGKPVREPQAWSAPIDHALRRELSRAAWRNMAKKPTWPEQAASTISFFFIGMSQFWNQNFDPRPLPVAIGMINAMRFGEVAHGADSWREAHFSLLPFYHIDRAAAVSARLACSRLVKAL